MGEAYPPPAESDVRAEGMFLIREAERRRHDEEAREPDWRSEESHTGATLSQSNGMVLGTRPVISDCHAEQVNGSGSAPRRYWKGNGDVTTAQTLNSTPSTSRYPQGSNAQSQPSYPPNGNGPSASYASQPSGSSSQYHLAQVKASMEDFDAEYSAIQADYAMRQYASARATGDTATAMASATGVALASTVQEDALGRGVDGVKPPKFHPGQRPTVVLDHVPGKKRNDRLEKEYTEGFDGLTNEVVRDCDGFVNNVRVSGVCRGLSWPVREVRRMLISGPQDNLQNILVYFFPQPSSRRDAFLDRIGRGLVDLGWSLTDNGDANL